MTFVTLKEAMEIMEEKLGFIEERIKIVANVEKKSSEQKFLGGALIGAQHVKSNKKLVLNQTIGFAIQH